VRPTAVVLADHAQRSAKSRHTRHIFQKLSLPEGALENKRVNAVLAYLRA
jgi:hypothetical protein